MHIASSLLTLLLAGIGCAASVNVGSQYSPKQPPLTTPWTDEVGTNPWPEYPRPQLQRSEWKNLNGIWRYENATNLQSVQNPPFGKRLSQEVLVPSCLESALSGKFVGGIARKELLIDCMSRDPRGVYAEFMVLHVFHCPKLLEKAGCSAQLWCCGL